MEPEGSSTHSHVPATCPYSEPARSSPHLPHPTSRKSILILSSPLRLGLPYGLSPSDFPTKIQYTPLLSPIRATCPTHHGLPNGHNYHLLMTTLLIVIPKLVYGFVVVIVAVRRGQPNINTELSEIIPYRPAMGANPG